MYHRFEKKLSFGKILPKNKMLEVKGSWPQFFFGDAANLAIVHKRI
jgi:hypothetical protein